VDISFAIDPGKFVVSLIEAADGFPPAAALKARRALESEPPESSEAALRLQATESGIVLASPFGTDLAVLGAHAAGLSAPAPYDAAMLKRALAAREPAVAKTLNLPVGEADASSVVAHVNSLSRDTIIALRNVLSESPGRWNVRGLKSLLRLKHGSFALVLTHENAVHLLQAIAPALPAAAKRRLDRVFSDKLY
jgi:hypothetical protein